MGEHGTRLCTDAAVDVGFRAELAGRELAVASVEVV